MKPRLSHTGLVRILTALFALEFAVLAVSPLDRTTWLLENLLVVALVAVWLPASRHFVPSRVSASLVFAFLAVHEIGAHYTYSEVPYDAWARAFLGTSVNDVFGWQRNHFDRAVHLLCGLLLAYPLREVFLRVADVRGFWGYASPVGVAISCSALYEMLEWAAAWLFGGDVGVAYLGTQGDEWDAQKDMALASGGALAAMTLNAGFNLWLQRDFAREWVESLRVKHAEPLGEDALARMLEERGGEGPSTR